MPEIEKPCVICGRSCVDQPRIKDASGRYAHKSCAQARSAKKAGAAAYQDTGPQTQHDDAHDLLAAGAGADDDAHDPIMDDLLGDLPGASEDAPDGACPSCRAQLPEGAVVCVSCGFNTQSGLRVGTSAPTRAPKAKKPKSGRSAGLAKAGSLGAELGGAALAPFFPIIGAAIGGAVGAIGWAAVAYFTGYELGILAMLVGAICGVGASIGSFGKGGIWPGVVAVAVALFSILVGKFAVYEVQLMDYSDQLAAYAQDPRSLTADDLTDQDYTQYIADELARERVASGAVVGWPDPEMTVEYAYFPDDFPRDIVNETNTSYNGLSSPERDELAPAVIESIVFDASDVTPERLRQYIADEIVYARLDRGETIDWPDPQMSVDFSIFPDDYPQAIISETNVRYESLDDTQRTAMTDRVVEDHYERLVEFQQGLSDNMDQIAGDAVFENLSLFDGLWAFLALGAAWGVGSGGGGDDE